MQQTFSLTDSLESGNGFSVIFGHECQRILQGSLMRRVLIRKLSTCPESPKYRVGMSIHRQGIPRLVFAAPHSRER